MNRDLQNEHIMALLTSHQQRLTAFVRSLILHPADADEVVQEVNLYIWRKADDFSLGTDFTAWALRVAHFEVLTYRKRLARDRARLSDVVLEQLVDQATDLIRHRSIRQEAIENCVQELPEKDRDLIALRYNSGATALSVAQLTGRPVTTIYDALSRIHARLLRCVERALTAEDRA